MKDLIPQLEAHLEDLRDAWERGVITEHDGQGGTRSNRNNDLLIAIRAELLKRTEEKGKNNGKS